MDRVGRSWTPQEERIVSENAVSAQHSLVEHQSTRQTFIEDVSGTASGLDAGDHPAGTSRFVFATGAQKPSEIVIYASSIAEAKLRARKLCAAAELRRIQHVVG